MKEWIRSKHGHLELVSGVSILGLAFVSKRMLSEPMDNFLIALPALMVVAAEATLRTKKKAWYTKTGYWTIAVAIVTILIVGVHLV